MPDPPAPPGTVMREDYEALKRELEEQKRINEFDRVVPIQELREELDRAESDLAAAREALRGQGGIIAALECIEKDGSLDQVSRAAVRDALAAARSALPEDGK